MFAPYTLDEALRAARIIVRDESIALEVRSLIPVGLASDLRPAHLMPRAEDLGFALRLRSGTIRTRRLLWELVDERTRFDLVHRACRMILAWRGERLHR